MEGYSILETRSEHLISSEQSRQRLLNRLKTNHLIERGN
ncbi:MAG: hypothetical protein ACI8P9_004024 [Parasphingorhabdus sp.]